MAELTFGEIGITFQATINALDQTQSPPVTSPMNLTGATVFLLYGVAKNAQDPPVPTISRQMTILDPVNGIVQYTFQPGDLVKPSGVGKNAVFRYVVKIQFPNGNIFYTDTDKQFTIKDDSVL